MKQKTKQLKYSCVLLGIFVLLNRAAFAANETTTATDNNTINDTDNGVPAPTPSLGTVKAQTTESRVRLGLDASFMELSYKGKSLSGPGVGVGVQYALSKKWGLTGSFNQSFGISGFSSVCSGISLGLVYALTGTLISKIENVDVGANEVMTSEDYHRGGLRIILQSDLDFFSSVNSVIPFTGGGIAFGYEFPSSSHHNYTAGFRFDMVSSSAVNLSPIQAFFGVIF